MTAATLWIGGEWTGAARGYEREDPAVPGRSTGSYARAELADVERAFAAAAAAQPAWAARSA
jgi:aldehyde dehydrogenase (NAD+)